MLEYKNFRAGDLFEIRSNPQLNKESFNFVEMGYPYFTRTANNNGILGYVDYLDEEHKIKGNSLAIGMIEMRFHYMERDFYAGQFTKTAFPKFEHLNKRIALYFISLFDKYQPIFKGVLIRDFIAVFSGIQIPLPVDSVGKIDYKYMEDHILELEHARIKELEKERSRQLSACLQITGLTDYRLTTDEEIFLKNFRAGGARYKTFRVDELFEINSPKKKFNANTLKFGGNYRYIARGDVNNGIRGYIDEDTKYLNSKNTISFGQDTATFFFQKEPYFTGDKIKVFNLRHQELTREIALFLITVLKKVFTNFGWGKSLFNVNALKAVGVDLPVNNDDLPDYEYMSAFIRIQQKIAIKSNLDRRSREIDCYKTVIDV